MLEFRVLGDAGVGNLDMLGGPIVPPFEAECTRTTWRNRARNGISRLDSLPDEEHGRVNHFGQKDVAGIEVRIRRGRPPLDLANQ